MANRKFSEQELIRRNKYKKLIEKNRDPFLETKFEKNLKIENLIVKFEKFTKEELSNKNDTIIKIAGRIRFFREAGKKAVFANIQDESSLIQIYVREDELGADEFVFFRDLDLGDIVGLEGVMMKTDHGELTLRVKKYKLLSKSLRPLPDKYHGLSDVEEKYRRRYVDLIVDENVKNVFIKRFKIIRTIQKILDGLGCIEVETPVLNLINGGASAKPFITFYNSLDKDFYLRIATELYLKRCIVGGFEGVYEIGRLFRNEGIDTRHSPEFTSIEIYIAYKDFYYMMDLTELLFRESAKVTLGSLNLNFAGIDFDLSKKFNRVHMVDAIKEKTGIDFWKNIDYGQAIDLAKKHNINFEKHHSTVGHIINLFFEYFVEPTIIQPTFVIGHPKEISPLSKCNKGDPRFTDRFELFINGREYANAFSELNNPIDQYERFLDQLKEKKSGNEEAADMDIDFIEALEYGMPPTVGIGIGIDRLVMFLTNCESIRDVILFPQLKPRG